MGRVGKVKTNTGSSSANRKAARRREQRKAERKKVKRAELKRRRSQADDASAGRGSDNDDGGDKGKGKIRRRESKDGGNEDDVATSSKNKEEGGDGDSSSEMGDELQMTERQLLGILRRSAPSALATRRGVLTKANIPIPEGVEQVHKHLESQASVAPPQGKDKYKALSSGQPHCDVVVTRDSVHTVGLYLAPYNMPELVWTRLPNAPALNSIMSVEEWRRTAQGIANTLRVQYGKDAMTDVAQGPEGEEGEASEAPRGRLDHLQVNVDGEEDVTYVFTAMDPLQVPQTLCTFYLYYGGGDDIFDVQAALPGDDEESDWDAELARVPHPVPLQLTVLQCLLGDSECQHISHFIADESK